MLRVMQYLFRDIFSAVRPSCSVLFIPVSSLNSNCFLETFCPCAMMIMMIFLLKVVDVSKNITEIPEWFRGCQLNYAENILEDKDENSVALITHGWYCKDYNNITILV